jgi:hypothetical protein
VRLLHQRGGVAHEARQQPHHRLGDRQGRHLSSVEHVVAEADLTHLGPLGGRLDHALVDALVAADQEDQPRSGRQLAGERLGERLTAGRRDDHGGPVDRQLVEGLAERLGLHHHPGTSAVRRVVHGVVPIVGPPPQVVDVEFEQP